MITIRSACIFWDNSNIFHSAQTYGAEQQGEFYHNIRIHFDHLYDLIRHGKRIDRLACSASGAPDQKNIRRFMEAKNADLSLYERGKHSGREQGVDVALRYYMLKNLCDLAPQTAILLSGDGGFMDDLERMHKGGWQIELVCWDATCNKNMKRWVEEVGGRYRPLEDYYEQVTFVEGARRASRPRLAVQSNPADE